MNPPDLNTAPGGSTLLLTDTTQIRFLTRPPPPSCRNCRSSIGRMMAGYSLPCEGNGCGLNGPHTIVHGPPPPAAGEAPDAMMACNSANPWACASKSFIKENRRSPSRPPGNNQTPHGNYLAPAAFAAASASDLARACSATTCLRNVPTRPSFALSVVQMAMLCVRTYRTLV